MGGALYAFSPCEAIAELAVIDSSLDLDAASVHSFESSLDYCFRCGVDSNTFIQNPAVRAGILAISFYMS